MTHTGAMSDADTSHARDDEHATGHGHASAGEPLGPVDVTAWGYALVGGVIGVLVALALFVARGG